MLTILLFILFGGLAVGCAVAVVAQRNPLYSAISLVGVFVALACLYMTLAAPFIAAVQVIVYAGAIMVLVVFVIMLLNVEEEVRRPVRLRYLIPVAVALAAVLVAETAFMLTLGGPGSNRFDPSSVPQTGVGLTASVGTGLFTEYLLPFEVTSVLILMALVGAITLARRTMAPAVAAPDYALGPSEYAIGDDDVPRTLPEAATPADAVRHGDTETTGREMARLQIEQEEAERASRREPPREEGGRR
ncbi:MAG TPA: NADH-quinone oxidoreductase subunit J [Pyrinomonadaceae bacterium]|nr:NADH-quinone oxidoreductase subunit J [Pyrinomonadaceae bacterium]